jgi:hypothetical protein
LPGSSLRRFWQDPPTAARTPAYAELGVLPDANDWEPIARGPMNSLVVGGLHLIENGDGVLELYDLDRDPDEEVDLSGTPAMAACVTVLKSMLDSAMASATPVAAPGSAARSPSSGPLGPEPEECSRSPRA